jgi:hypothetical protein
VRPVGCGRTLLSIEGIHRLARHVVRNWIERAGTSETKPFSYWDALPNILRMQPASEFWVWNAAGLTPATAGKYLAGCLDIWLGLLGGHRDTWVDLRDVLARIEQIAAGTAPHQRAWMVALYTIWHGNLRQEYLRPSGDAFVARHSALLEPPSMAAFVVELATGSFDWPLETVERAAALRRTDRGRKQDWPVHEVFDAALLAILADQLEAAGRHDEAVAAIDEAIGELPGNGELIRMEQALLTNEQPCLDLKKILAPDAADADPATAPDVPALHEPQAPDEPVSEGNGSGPSPSAAPEQQPDGGATHGVGAPD